MKVPKALITFCLLFIVLLFTVETVNAAPLMEISIEIVKGSKIPHLPKAVRAEAGTEAFREALEDAQDLADCLRKMYGNAQVHVTVSPLARIIIENKHGDKIVAPSKPLRMGSESFRVTLSYARALVRALGGKYGKLFVRIELAEAEQ